MSEKPTPKPESAPATPVQQPAKSAPTQLEAGNIVRSTEITVTTTITKVETVANESLKPTVAQKTADTVTPTSPGKK
jgi:hypothetical protein